MRFIIEHTGFHFGWPEFIVLIFMLCVFFLVWKNLRKYKETHEKLDKMASELNVSPDEPTEAETMGTVLSDSLPTQK